MRETKDIEMNSLAVECEDCMSTHKIAVYITFAESVSYREAEQYVTELICRGQRDLENEVRRERHMKKLPPQ
ncbi:MAG: hypothetical protein ACLSCC_13345 [Coprococcus sp.]|nr:MAG TPA: hypothetical protein [Caudoviricetes sp.]